VLCRNGQTFSSRTGKTSGLLNVQLGHHMQEKEIKVEIIANSVIVHQYRYFYYLANELAFMAGKDKFDQNIFRYAVGTVIMSYTTIETYFNHLLFSEKYPLRRIHEGMSDELLGKIERMSLPEKIEFAVRFYPDAKQELLKIGWEPYQSFDLLRQMRNLLVHYIPKQELVWSVTGEHIDNIEKLEKRLTGKFSFLPSNQIHPGDSTKAFLYRIFNRECAKWSFERVAPFISALSETFQIPHTPLRVVWDFKHGGPNQ
jgi:hypothetical protein